MKFAQVITVPHTLSSLKNAQEDEEALANICEVKLGANQPAQCMSARFVDPNGETLFCYFGRRIYVKGMEPPVRSADIN